MTPILKAGRHVATVFLPVENSYTDSQQEVFIELCKKSYIQYGHVFVLPIPEARNCLILIEQEFGQFEILPL